MKAPTYEEIKPYIDKGLVKAHVHPENPDVMLFNYTKDCEWEKQWDDITRQCRCLILNVKTGEVIARPVAKFFNYGEWISMGNKIPEDKPIVLEKLDGMLGVLYWMNGEPFIASRGSFTSDFAKWATEWIRRPENITKISKSNLGWTYIFEIIYSKSRIVLKYDYEELVWLGEVNKRTGSFVPSYYNTLGFRVPQLYEFSSIEELSMAPLKDKEGYVLQYQKADLLLKLKFKEYMRLHKIMTGVSVLGIWEFMKEKGIDVSPSEVVQDVPDEFFGWVKQTMEDIVSAYRSIEADARETFNQVAGLPRAEAARIVQDSKWPGIAFLMLNGKDYSEGIFKKIRPYGNVTFRLGDKI